MRISDWSSDVCSSELGEKLVLTGDQNIVDLAYSVRWNIRDAALYKFQLVDPEQTIREVAESAMRSIVATVSLNDTIGSGRSEIEQRVQQRMQEILDEYRSGILDRKSTRLNSSH